MGLSGPVRRRATWEYEGDMTGMKGSGFLRRVVLAAALAGGTSFSAMAGDGKLFVIHQDGRLRVLSTADGNVLSETRVPSPAWDGLAIAQGRLFLTTQDGRLLCLGE